MLLLSPLCLLLCWMLPVDSMRTSSSRSSIRLDDAPNSVDDMYSDCAKQMADDVRKKYFQRESAGIFGKVWRNAATCSDRKLKIREREDQALTKDHFQAICVYTSNYQKFYETFNNHVRSDRSVYGTEFPFHSLHFWLTTAVQILNKNECVTTYRRTNQLVTGTINQNMRFGSFTSSSKKPTLTRFGSKTCFQITTCSGGFLKDYSLLKNTEEEVLIPPYEMFKIIAKQQVKIVHGWLNVTDLGFVSGGTNSDHYVNV